MELAGVVLATIPLVVTALDNYVDVLDTMRLFRTKKYRRYLERCSSFLGAHQASLLNAIEIAVESDISKKGLDDLKRLDSAQCIWKDTTLQATLQKNLDRDYDTFMNMLEEANHILQELNNRLEKEVAIPPDKAPSRTLIEIRKVKHILSKERYKRLFDDLDTSIGLLKGLAEHSGYRRERGQIARGSQYGIARLPAASIYKALVREGSWRCPCRDKHSIRLTVDLDFEAKEMSKIMFRITVVTLADPAQPLYSWQEIEVEPSRRSDGTVQISDLCSAFAAIGPDNGQRNFMGTLPEGIYRHQVYITRSNKGNLEYRSLEDMLMSSTLAPWIPGFYFRKKDRLCLALRLARSVLHLHGNWLRESWRTRDIMFPKGTESVASQVPYAHPFLAWSLSQEGVTGSVLSSAIGSQVLFPLGLALTELSLCRPVSALQIPPDENPEEAVSLLKTANRCLDDVNKESGQRYATAVQRCLYWSETRETDLEDEDFRAAFYQLIISPLEDVVKAFGGN
ncbi:hypothetical protein BJX61DRAFT_543604 [Aspergillus egyptiacus]|nr:hypothetical protein BJX61DRAFT_543604 [Aspergillus egyptiacus]